MGQVQNLSIREPAIAPASLAPLPLEAWQEMETVGLPNELELRLFHQVADEIVLDHQLLHRFEQMTDNLLPVPVLELVLET